MTAHATGAATERGGAMSDAGSYYNSAEMVGRFRDKGLGQFFRSETDLLTRVAWPLVNSCLDVGCAAGRFLGLLRHHGFTGTYTGIDLAPANITNGSTAYPEAEFILGDALTMTVESRRSLVNATGIVQNEPRYQALLSWMCAASDRYVMFDLKVADISATLHDPDQAYCAWEGHRIPVICLSEADFVALLADLSKRGHVHYLRYPTPFNAETTVPDWLTSWDSAGILLDMVGTPCISRIDHQVAGTQG